jgi:hypothetical protein
MRAFLPRPGAVKEELASGGTARIATMAYVIGAATRLCVQGSGLGFRVQGLGFRVRVQGDG